MAWSTPKGRICSKYHIPRYVDVMEQHDMLLKIKKENEVSCDDIRDSIIVKYQEVLNQLSDAIKVESDCVEKAETILSEAEKQPKAVNLK